MRSLNTFYPVPASEQLSSTWMGKPGEKDTVILVCGPPAFMKSISGEKDFSKGGVPEQGKVGGLLKDMGYSEKQVYKF